MIEPMKIKTEEIKSIIRKEIEGYKKEFNVSEVGTVIQVGDGIARLYGLSNAMAGAHGAALESEI